MKLITRLIDRFYFFESRNDFTNQFPDALVFMKFSPWNRAILENPRDDLGDDASFASRTFVSEFPPLTQTNEIEHAFLGGPIRFFVAGQYGKEKSGLPSPTEMSLVKRCVHI